MTVTKPTGSVQVDNMITDRKEIENLFNILRPEVFDTYL